MITFNKKELQNALKQLSPVFASNSIIPLCHYVHVSVRGGIATLSANNTNLCINCDIECRGGDVVFVFKFSDLSKLLPNLIGEEIELFLEDLNIKLTCGKQKFWFAVEDATHFPEMLKTKNAISVDVAQDFIDALQEAVKHETKTDPRAEGCCINFNDDSTVDVVGTNKDKLFWINLPYAGQGQYHVTTQFVNAINYPGTLKIDQRNITLESISNTISCVLIDQPYINFKFPFRVGMEPNFYFSRSEMLLNLDSILCFGDEIFTEAKMVLTADKINFNYEKDTIRGAELSMPCRNESPVENISFNAAFLKSILLAQPTNEVSAMITDKSKPMFIIAPSIKNFISPLVNNN